MIKLRLAPLLLLTACTRPVPMEFVSVCAAENEKKTVEVTGYIDDGGRVFCSNHGGRMECGFRFTQNPGEKKGFSAEIQQGSGANAVEKLPSGYTRADLKIRDDNANPINLANKVKITGKISVTPDLSVCFVTVTKIVQ
ncbi:MAG: hypothetical protein HYX27_12650 [Acidobacteria bacterium]|nr:hypothetical protein [Acidobacteriota bacterium]